MVSDPGSSSEIADVLVIFGGALFFISSREERDGE